MATGAYDKARSTVEDLTTQGRDHGKQAIDQTQAMVTEVQGRLEQFAREQPILVAALGVAFGAALGAALPMTKAEQDYMGAAGRNGERARHRHRQEGGRFGHEQSVGGRHQGESWRSRRCNHVDGPDEHSGQDLGLHRCEQFSRVRLASAG